MKRVERLTPFIVMEIVEKANMYEDVIHMEIGQPDLLPAPNVQKRAVEAIEQKRFGYTTTEGLEELRIAIARHYRDFYKVEVDWHDIILTPGSSGAFLLAYSLSLDYGERLGFAVPGYPSYKNFAYTLDIEPVFIEVFGPNDYCITPDDIKKTKLHALQISNPSNPTGNIYTSAQLRDLSQECRKKGIKLISDELYQGLVYEHKPLSLLSIDPEAIVISGFSKYFCMPGFRLGWIVVPPYMRKRAIELAQNLFISPPTISQYAALGAFDEEYLRFVNETYRQRRDFLYYELSDLFLLYKPQGAFYLWADISRYSKDSVRFCEEVLQKAKVALTPGIDFGQKYRNFVRISFTSDTKSLKEGAQRLRAFLG